MINTGNARINSRPLRWLTDKMASLRADDTADLTHENSETPSRRRENPTDDEPAKTSYPPYHRVTEAADLIPKVNGLSFVNDYPRVMRFHAGFQSPWTTQRSAESEMDGIQSLEQSADGKNRRDAEGVTGRSGLQGMVAGASFVGGLAVSMSLCLLCYHIRRRSRRRTFDQKQLNESSIVATVLDAEETKTEP